ncbi:hypothetical protein BHM03_00022028 [Ensete ventricosum]|nr:hypothetical protein BHM03_00022028 [Ensete ventricosum]
MLGMASILKLRDGARVSIGFLCNMLKFQNIDDSQRISPWESQVSICFSCTISEFQNPDHSQRISHGRSYERDFTKKCNGHKLCAKSRVESTFDRFFMHHLRISKY